MDLRLHAIALSAAGMDATYIPAGEEFDMERVDIQVDVDGFETPLTIQITCPPIGEGALGGLEMVQIYAPVPVVLTEAQLLWLAIAINHANELSPLIGFSVHEGASILYFRTVMLLPPHDISYTMVIEGVSRTHYALDLHAANLIEGAMEETADEQDEVDSRQ